MRRENPEALVVPPECEEALALGHVPDANAAILTVREDQVLTWMEQHAGHVVVVAAAGVHLPGLVLVHSPQLHQAIIGTGHNQW